ncbi:efflux RND transporter periplasmic adaptor subunit [Cupriavidus respiraculi]|uniref:Cobalt-zinc-cadmium resistance protein CzcB n=1 Tax=Cupriavidus respiraculi TaxID=195930 RepID=A0ABN7Y7B0_9BURK|nr:efflux RND transporter periplasmic adaptor subunit [Cupriavidus respiraculi]MBY4948294.1 efflux RND transporter periplasmic adaptor subunit [Cupriavidus respiraculi]CAG9167835.1 Cobalt-zinc-cadmium resistance protein CzcB [Cupriavidus respiraculi]
MKTNKPSGLSRRQKAAIALIVLAGLLAGTALLMTGHGERHDDHGGHAADTAAHDQHEDREKHEDHDHAKGAPAATETVAMTAEQIREAGIAVRSAGPAQLAATVPFPGEIRFNEDRTAHVTPRVGGVVESVPAALGQQVKKGEVLAVIASSALADLRGEWQAARRRLELAQSTYQREKTLWQDRISAEQDYLAARTAMQEARIAADNAAQKLNAIGAGTADGASNRFTLRAPFDGVIVEKHITLGEAVAAETNVFTLSDLSTVWAEFSIAPKDLAHVRVGERASVASAAQDGAVQGTVSYVGALLGQQTRTATARVTLRNPSLAWRPGLFVTVSVAGPEVALPIAVEAEAVQTEGDHATVFVAVPGGFVARSVRTGRRIGDHVEIVQGLAPGETYAATNTFVLKAERGKADAEHTH